MIILNNNTINILYLEEMSYGYGFLTESTIIPKKSK